MKMPWIGYNTAEKSLKNDFARPFCTPKTEKRILFLKNEPGKLLKTNDKLKKRTGNEAKTKLPKLLKIKEWPKKRTGNKPENEAGHVIENKGSLKNEPETNRNLSCLPEACLFPAGPASRA